MSNQKLWVDPAKKPALASTMNITGDFDRFTGVMERLMQVRPEDVREANSPAARAPDASYTDRSASEPNDLRQP